MPNALLIERDPAVRRIVQRRLRLRGFHVTWCASREEAELQLESLRPDLVVVDTELPDGSGLELSGLFPEEWAPQVIALSDTDTLAIAVDAMRRGAVDVLAKPVNPDRLDDALRKVKATLKTRSDLGTLREQLRRLGRFGRLVGRSESMQTVYDLIAKVAPTESTVMILGETGTGKEVVARTIHDESERSDGPFVPVNCGALAPNLIESELFGHEKGAFTGAAERRKGLFEAAAGGTLLLDEITEMSPELQVRLLRVLETGAVRRIGAQRAVRVDVRILAATNRDPEVAVRDGELREDLLYRLMVFPIRIPPLRERRDDVGLLAQHFLDELNRDLRKDLYLTPEALDELSEYDWPGNVRELRNVLERSGILAQSRIEPDDLPLGQKPRRHHPRPHTTGLVGKTIKEMEKELILATVDHHGGDRKDAARTLGICVKTLYNRLRTYREEGEVD